MSPFGYVVQEAFRMTVLGVGLVSSEYYQQFIEDSKKLKRLYEEAFEPRKTLFNVKTRQQIPHATLFIANVDKQQEDSFVKTVRHVASVLSPVHTTTTREFLGADGMEEQQLEKTDDLVRAQDQAIFELAPLRQMRSMTDKGQPVAGWPSHTPPGGPIDDFMFSPMNLQDRSDLARRLQYLLTGYDEVDGNIPTLLKVLSGQPRTLKEIEAAQKPAPFNRHRPHQTRLRIEQDHRATTKRFLEEPLSEGRPVKFDLLVVSEMGQNGTYAKPIAAYELASKKLDNVTDTVNGVWNGPETTALQFGARKGGMNPFLFMGQLSVKTSATA